MLVRPAAPARPALGASGSRRSWSPRRAAAAVRPGADAPALLRARAAGRRARHQDRHAHPLREPARGGRRPHRQRRRRLRAHEGGLHRRRLRHRHHLRRVTPKGEYLGGVIAPASRSRRTRCSRAPRSCRASRSRSRRAWSARNTVHSMQSGIVYGYVGLVDGICERMRRELGFPCKVVATGGLAPLIASESKTIQRSTRTSRSRGCASSTSGTTSA